MYYEWVFVCPQPLKVQVQVSLQKTPWVHFWPQGQGEGWLVGLSKGSVQEIGISWVFGKIFYVHLVAGYCIFYYKKYLSKLQINYLLVLLPGNKKKITGNCSQECSLPNAEWVLAPKCRARAVGENQGWRKECWWTYRWAMPLLSTQP